MKGPLKRYTDSHEWIDEEGKVGITDYAQGELGPIVFVDLPKIGRKVKAKEAVGLLESSKAASDLYTPVSGTISEVNEALLKNPSLLNREAESGGWIFKVALSEKSELDPLLTLADYTKLLR